MPGDGADGIVAHWAYVGFFPNTDQEEHRCN